MKTKPHVQTINDTKIGYIFVMILNMILTYFPEIHPSICIHPT